MKKTISLLWFSIIFYTAFAGNTQKPFVIPELKEWSGKEGSFALNGNSRIVYNAAQPALKQIAEQLSEDYFTLFNRKLPVDAGKPLKGDISLDIKKDKNLGREGYAVRIGNNVEVSAPEAIGVYWATRTLLQMSEQTSGHHLPKGTIRDYPDYEMRGFMMDCGRKYIPLPYLRDLVKIMSYYKMNTLQVHLNDNGFKQYYGDDWDKTYAAFRLECDTYPGLTAFDGFYTKSEFRDFQKESESYGIEIIPEIDVPAHALAFTQYMPEIGSREYGMDHLDIFNPKTYRFADDLFKEYLEGEDPVFYGKKVHIGTDEYSNAKKEVVEKFRYFTDYYIRQVESYGKEALVWGSLTHAKGDTPVKSENVLMSAWSSVFADPDDMVRQGYKLISIRDFDLYIVPGAPYYHDYLEEEKLYAGWLPENILKDPNGQNRSGIVGGMFAVWNDHVGNGISIKDIHHRLYPALQTLSVKMWTGHETSVPYAEFDERRLLLSEAPGVNQMGRVGKNPGVVLEQKQLAPLSETGIPEIGYNYTVSFDIDGKNEKPGTPLFTSPNAVFYLSDPVRGLLGFVRDGYLNTFRYQVRDGEKANIRIEGDHKSTTLKVNGKVVDELGIRMSYFNGGKDSLEYFSTLVFPLEKAGDFNSRVENLKVSNFIED